MTELAFNHTVNSKTFEQNGVTYRLVDLPDSNWSQFFNDNPDYELFTLRLHHSGQVDGGVHHMSVRGVIQAINWAHDNYNYHPVNKLDLGRMYGEDLPEEYRKVMDSAPNDARFVEIVGDNGVHEPGLYLAIDAPDPLEWAYYTDVHDMRRGLIFAAIPV